MSDEEFEKILKEICPDWIPIEERSSEEQEKAYERIFYREDE